MREHPPYFFEQAAAHALEQKAWDRAIRALNEARAASLGHGRRERYENHAQHIARTHNIKSGWGYMTEDEIRDEEIRQKGKP